MLQDKADLQTSGMIDLLIGLFVRLAYSISAIYEGPWTVFVMRPVTWGPVCHWGGEVHGDD